MKEAILKMPNNLYLTSKVVDWGKNRRGQGKRRGYMIMGAMSDMPQGLHTYTDIVGKLRQDADEEMLADLRCLESGFLGQCNLVYYAKARAYGLNHEEAFQFVIDNFYKE